MHVNISSRTSLVTVLVIWEVLNANFEFIPNRHIHPQLAMKNVHPQQTKKPFSKLSYLDGISRCVMPQPDSVSWNAQHWRKCSEPAEAMGPPWELVVQVFHRCEFDDVEDENSLRR